MQLKEYIQHNMADKGLKIPKKSLNKKYKTYLRILSKTISTEK